MVQLPGGLAWLARHGVKSVRLSGGYGHEVITDYAGDGSRFGVEIRYAIEDEQLGRGGGLKYGARRLDLLRNSPQGDVL